MMDKMGLDMEEIPNVQEVIIKTDKKEIIIPKPSVTEMKSKENSIFQVIAESFEEKELEVPIFSEDDIMLVCQQANCDEEKAKNALAETKGDIAQAILMLTNRVDYPLNLYLCSKFLNFEKTHYLYVF
jgi:nascent polypeptide-associated complex subunit alpha